MLKICTDVNVEIAISTGLKRIGIFYIHPLKSSIGESIRKLKEYAELFDINILIQNLSGDL